MLQLYGLNKVKIAGLKNYKDLSIESNLSSGDRKLSFLYPLKEANEIVAEGYIRTKTDEFVIKEIGTAGEWKTIKAILNTEDLEGNVFEHFDTTNKDIAECLMLALAGTGWTVGTCNVTRRRTVRKTNSSTWEIVQEAKKVYRAELEFDTLNKKINIFEKRGTDKGTYFIESLNLKDLDVQSNSYDFYTRIIAIGKDDLRVTLENYQYSSKRKTFIWVDDRYTDKNALTEDAKAKLDELSKPYRAYSASIIDLASMNAEYRDILNYKLGDTITLISKDKEIKEKQRIVKIVEYPEEPERNTCEIANTTLKFEDLQKEFQDTSDTVNNITTDDGTINGETINGISSKKIYDLEANVVRITNLTVVNAKIEHLYADKADIGSLNAVIANIGILNATKANITDLKAINASITDLKADKANILDLKATNAKVNVLEVNTGNIQTLLAGNLTAINMQAGGITSDKLTIQNGFITNLMVANIDVSKINAGIINTNKFTIKSADGGIEIVGATQQFKDKNNKVRIQMGKDTQGNFNFILRGEDGATTLIDHTGIKKDAIADDLIVKEMIGSNAIGAKQLDYSSFAEGFNKDTNTHTLKATHIKLDNQNQTLDMAFNSLKTEVQDIEIGGRNLLGDSECNKTLPSLIFNGNKVTANNLKPELINNEYINITPTNNTSTDKFLEIGFPSANNLNGFELDTFYTLSFDCYIPTGAELPYVRPLYSLNKLNMIEARIPVTNVEYVKFKRYSGTFKFPSASTGAFLRIQFPSNVLNCTYKIKNIKLEEGTKVSSYTVAPEDVDKSINVVKEITTSNSTTIGIQQGQIDVAIANSQIIKGGKTIWLKDDYNLTVQTVNSTTETIGQHKTVLDANTKGITDVKTDVTEVKKSLEGITSRVGSSETNITATTATANSALSNASTAQTQANLGVTNAKVALDKAVQVLADSKAYTSAEITTVNKSVSNANSEINQLKNKIELKVGQTDVNTAITNIVVGGRNLFAGFGKNQKYSYSHTGFYRDYYTTIKLLPNTTYTFSYDFNIVTGVITDLFVGIGYGTLNSYAGDFLPWATQSLSGKAVTFKTPIELPANMVYFHWRPAIDKSNTNRLNKIDFTDIKLEKGNKATDWTPTPEDVDQAIADTITINETKIKQAKAEILLETNAIKLAVSSVDSTVAATTKTANSALTNAGTATTAAQKAATAAKNAQDGVESISGSVRNLKDSTEKTISITNNKLADVAIELNGITSRVSSEEKKSTAIDNKVIAQDTRLTSAESKITSNAIISTVQATINTAQTNAINSANGSTDGKLKSYSTTSQMATAITQSAAGIKQEVSNTYITTGNANNSFATKSSVAQTDIEWRATFKSSGGYNLIPNGKALLNTNGWRNNGGTRFNREYYEMGSAFAMSMPNGINFEGWIKLERGVDYVYSAKFYSDVAGSGSASTPLHFWVGTSEANNSFVTVIDHNQGTILARWQDLYVHFITRPDVDTFFKPFIYGGPTTAVASITNIMLAKGTMVTPWVPNSNEVYSGNTSIDSGGVTIYNGAIRVLDGAGNEVLKGDSSGISFSGRLQPRDNTIRLFGENCRIDGSGGAIRMQKDPYNYVSVDSSYTRFYNGYSGNGTNLISLGVDSQGHATLFGKTTMLKLLGSGTPSVQARWAGDGGYCMMQASSFTVSSSEVFKTNIEEPNNINFKEVLMTSKIKEYNLRKDLELVEQMPTVLLPNGENPIKADVKVGVILEELSEEGRSLLHPSSSDGVDLYSMCSILWKNVQNQQLTIEMFISLIIPFIKLVSQKLEINTEELNKKLEQLLIM